MSREREPITVAVTGFPISTDLSMLGTRGRYAEQLKDAAESETQIIPSNLYKYAELAYVKDSPLPEEKHVVLLNPCIDNSRGMEYMGKRGRIRVMDIGIDDVYAAISAEIGKDPWFAKYPYPKISRSGDAVYLRCLRNEPDRGYQEFLWDYHVICYVDEYGATVLSIDILNLLLHRRLAPESLVRIFEKIRLVPGRVVIFYPRSVEPLDSVHPAHTGYVFLFIGLMFVAAAFFLAGLLYTFV